MRVPSAPPGVVLVALWGILVGAIVGVGGLLILLTGFGIGLVLLAVGVFEIVSSMGLWRLRPWAWYVSIVLLPIGILANLFDASPGQVRGVVFAILQIIALLYLIRVRGHFLQQEARRGTPA